MKMGKRQNDLGSVSHPHIQEAKRYIANAREILTEKAGKSGKFYTDRKYVRMAGNTAWNGILEAIDGTFDIRASMKKDQRPDVKDYQQVIGKRNQSKLKLFIAAYDTLHKALGYDGNLSVTIVQEGLSEADEIIKWCESIT
jgi:Domain of unknown function (DUF5618)